MPIRTWIENGVIFREMTENIILQELLEALKTIAFSRLILPKTNIYVCGGRQITLRSLQSWIFLAGANGVMVGNYLTTKGSPWSEDQTMIQDLGFIPSGKLS